MTGKAITTDGLKEIPSNTTDPQLPPLIFPTDKQRNNIKPINKTAITILMHGDSLYNSSAMTKEEHKDTVIELNWYVRAIFNGGPFDRHSHHHPVLGFEGNQGHW